MARADWTYEVAPAGSSAAGLEEYVVVAGPSGERVGKVQTLLRRGDELVLAVERGAPPVTHDVRAVPWSEVEDVDHSALAVRLRGGESLLESVPELDPDKGVEGGDADAVRVTELPPALRASSVPGETAGPVDRSSYVVATALLAAALIAFLAVVLAASGIDADWKYALFAIPAVLALAAGAVGYATWRQPYERP